MCRWYRLASKYYVYLSDVSVPDEITNAEAFPIAWLEAFRVSRWFTRGWTLQELLAPTSVDFFCKQGKRLGSRLTLEQDIHRITRIPTSALRGQDLAGFTVEERMGWTAGRVTTVKEDKVYCLLGIFNVFLPLIYGEGESYAKTRLKDEIQRRQEGRGNQSLRNLSGRSSVAKASLFKPRRGLLISFSLLIRALPSERNIRRTDEGAPLSRTITFALYDT